MPMFIFTVILYQSFRRLLQQHRSRLLWITLVFLGAISFGTVEWATPLSAGTTPPTGKIRVFKVTKPSGDTTEFSFNLSGPKLKRTFSLADGERKNVANLTTGGGYSISEAVPAGWMLQSATCSDGSPIHNINVGANEVVDCTFVNVKLGTIVVKVTTLPDEDLATSFPLSAGGGLSPTTFTLKNGQHYTFADLVPGNHYNLVETVPAGWMLGSASCSDGSPFTKVDVSAGETVTCIFVNKQLGKLIIRKTTLPDPDRTASTFSFVTENTLSPNSFTLKNDEERSYSNVEPRAGYQIRELATPNWQLSSSSCDNDSPLNNIRIDPGQTVICSFTNRGTLIDLSLTKDDGGVTAEPRDTIVYTLRYRNKGNQTANGVTITEQVPANTTFVASPEIAALWDCANDAPAGSICHHTVGALAGGTQGQVEFHVKLLNSLPATVTTIDNTATLGYRDNPNAAHGNSSTPVKTKAVLTLNKGDDGAKAKPGDTIRYTLDYKNEGNQTISGVRITETVPLNTTFVDLGEGWSCVDGAPAGTRCVREIGSIGGGKDGSFPFTVKVATTLPPAITAIENGAIIGSPLYPNADIGTEQTEVQAAPDLAVTIDNNGATVAPGGTIRYQIGYANVGVQAATGVQLTADLPALTSFVAEQSTAGWSCNNSRCHFAAGTLASGASAELVWTLRLARPLPVDVSTLSATVTIADDGANGTDPVPANNTATLITVIVDSGKFVATKRATLAVDQNNDGKVAPGDTIEYVVALQNQRGIPVRNVVFTDTLPATVDLLPGLTTSQGTILAGSERSDRHVLVNIGALAGDSTVTIRFRTVIHLPLPAGIDQVANQGMVTGSDLATLVTDDPTTPTAHDVTVTPLIATPAVGMTLADFLFIDANGDTLVSVGDTLIYRLIVRNQGDSGSPPLQIRVPLPDNLLLVENSVTTSGGTIRAGNDPEDRAVRVDVGELDGRTETRLTFQAQILPDASAAAIQVQAVAVDQSPTGAADIYSDDPDTAATTDATVTLLNQPIVTNYPLYLPLIQR